MIFANKSHYVCDCKLFDFILNEILTLILELVFAMPRRIVWNVPGCSEFSLHPYVPCAVRVLLSCWCASVHLWWCWAITMIRVYSIWCWCAFDDYFMLFYDIVTVNSYVCACCMYRFLTLFIGKLWNCLSVVLTRETELVGGGSGSVLAWSLFFSRV